MFRKVLATCGLLISSNVALISLGSPASAIEAGDIVMRLNPAEQSIELTPGEKYSGEIEVKNIGRLPFSFQISAHPFQVKNADYDPDFETENNYTLLKNWIKFPQTEFRLEPEAETVVHYEVTVPQDVPGGGQYAAIIIETRDSIDPNSQIHTVSQLASIVYASVAGDTRSSGALVRRDLPGFLLGSPLSISATVENTGNIDFRLHQKLTVYNFFNGQEVYSGDSSAVSGSDPRVMPETTRLNVLSWSDAPQLGIFRVHQDIAFLDQSEHFEGVVFLCPLWLLLGVVFVIVLGVVWLVLRSVSRKRKQTVV